MAAQPYQNDNPTQTLPPNPSEDLLRFNKRKGTDSAGFDYEKFMITYLAIKCEANKYKDYWICSNADGLGTFDDVLLYTRTEDDRQALHFMQLKHKCNRRLFKPKDMDVYREDYEKIRKLLLVEDECSSEQCDDIVKTVKDCGVAFEAMKFVFFTNGDVKDSLKRTSVDERDEVSFLSAGRNGSIHQLEFDEAVPFTSQFYMFTKQAGISNDDDRIEQFIISELKRFNADACGHEDLQSKLLKEINKWIEGEECIMRRMDFQRIMAAVVSEICGISIADLGSANSEAWNLWKWFLVGLKEDRSLDTSRFSALARNLTFRFHGNETSFGSFIHGRDHIWAAFRFRDIVDLVKGDLNICEKQDVPSYYVPRKSPKIWAKPSIFDAKRQKFFLIASQSDANEYVKIHSIKMAANVQIVADLSQVQMDANVHVLRLRRRNGNLNLEWLHSQTDNATTIREHLSAGKGFTDLARRLAQPYVNAMVLVADPGMGKTVYMKHLYNTVQPDYWPMLVALNNFDFEAVIGFETLAQDYRETLSETERNLFDEYARHKRLVVFFDGYDEALSTCDRVILDALKANHKICVSSRESKRKHLVDLLKVHPYALHPFDADDKETFLNLYYNAIFEDKTDLVKSFVAKLAKKATFTAWDTAFSGIPLQLYLLAECFKDMCFAHVHSDSEYCVIPTTYTLIDLYQQFIDKLLERYLKEKLLLQDLQIKRAKATERSNFEKQHTKAALQLLFPDMNVRMSDDLKEHYNNYGLITRINGRGQPEFVHRTFAEFLAAKWFVHIRSTQKPVLHRLLQKENELIANIFDRIVCANCHLHLAVINRDVDAVKRALVERPVDDGMSDGGCGRTSVHLVANRGDRYNEHGWKHRYGSETYQEVLDVLFDRGAGWRDVSDRIFGLTAYEFAKTRLAFGILDTLLRTKFISTVDMELLQNAEGILRNCTSFNYASLARITIETNGLRPEGVQQTPDKMRYTGGNSLLHRAAMYNSADVLKILLPHFRALDPLNEENRTPLLESVGSKSFSAFELLVRNGANLFLKECPSYAYAIDNGDECFKNYLTELDNLLKWNPNGKIDEFLPDRQAIFGLGNALHWSSAAGNTKTLTALIEKHRMDVNVPSSNGYAPIYWAIWGRSEEALLLLLKHGAAVIGNYPKNNYTPLHEAIKTNRWHLVHHLLHHAESKELNLANLINVISCDNGTPLDHCNDAEGSNEIRDYLIGLGALTTLDIYKKHSNDWFDGDNVNALLPGVYNRLKHGSALHWAGAMDDPALMESLLQRPKVDVNRKSCQGYAPLFWAIEAGSLRAVETLLRNNADIYCNGPNYETCLHRAVKINCFDIVRCLLNHETSIKDKIPKGLTIVNDFFNGKTCLDIAADNGNAAMENVLTQFGGKTSRELCRNLRTLKNNNDSSGFIKDWIASNDINVPLPGRTCNGSVNGTVLHWASALGDTKLMETILQRAETDLTGKAYVLCSPLFWAIEGGSLAAVQLLLSQNGIDVYCRGRNGESCLRSATEKAHCGIVKCLLEHESELSEEIRNGRSLINEVVEGRTCLDVAYKIGNQHVINVLKRFDGKTSKPKTFKWGWLDLIIAADINRAIPGVHERYALRNGTVLHWASVAANTNLIEEILKRPNVNVNAAACYGYTPLFWAIEGRSTETVSLLLETGAADVLRCGRYQETCLYYAVKRQRAEIVRRILEHERNMTERSNLVNRIYCGETCLDLALRMANREIVNTLKEYGGKTYVELLKMRTG